MELAAFSDIEFVGIAADRHVLMDPQRRSRKDTCSGSSTISLDSVGSEVERYDQTLTASAFDIHEVYTVDPLSPSGLMVDSAVDTLPQTLPSLLDDGRDVSGDEANLPAVSIWSSDCSAILPLDGYRRDTQRHERVAVSVALGWPRDIATSEPAFRRSRAPSPSTERGLEISDVCIDVIHDVTAAHSVANLDDDDNQNPLKTYSLDRWFSSSMEKTQELAVVLQQPAVQPPHQTPASRQDSVPSTGRAPSGGPAEHDSLVSSISLHPVEPDEAPESIGDMTTDEDLQAFKTAIKRAKERIARAQRRTYRLGRVRKRRNDKHEHRQARPSRYPHAQPSN